MLEAILQLFAPRYKPLTCTSRQACTQLPNMEGVPIELAA